MIKKVEKKTNLWYFIGFVYLFMASAFFFSEKIAYIFSKESYMHIANTFFYNESNNLPVNTGLNTVYNTKVYEVKTTLQPSSDHFTERSGRTDRIYNNYNLSNNQSNRNESAGNQNINFPDCNRIENISHQNDNSRQSDASFPDLAIRKNISQLFSSAFKRGNDANPVLVEENAGLGTGLLASDISLNMSDNENIAYQRSGIDPNGDPVEAPIPVGDGSWLLLVVTLFYAGWKYSKLRAQEQSN
ncbi:MAG: hypothetical protein QM800_14200 [Paludibacter sp.]